MVGVIVLQALIHTYHLCPTNRMEAVIPANIESTAMKLWFAKTWKEDYSSIAEGLSHDIQ